MKITKKFIVLLLIGLIFVPAISYSAFYQATGVVSVTNLIAKILSIFWKVFVAFAVVCFVLAGIMFLTAMGNPEKVKTARNAAIFGAIGIVVAILAYSIVGIIEKEL